MLDQAISGNRSETFFILLALEEIQNSSGRKIKLVF
jgi:hypothetical protein